MARRITRRPCSECPCPIENNGTSTAHNVCPSCGGRCQGAAQAKRYTQFEPQRITEEAGPIGRPLTDPRNNPRHNEARQNGGFLSPVRIGVIDIETTGLNAGFGVILCAVVKAYAPDERKLFTARDYDPWKRGERANDGPLLRDLLAYIEDIDVLVAHNGLKFDLPFIRTRALVHKFPAVNFQKIIDPVQLARQHFRFPGNSLQSISGVIGTKAEKTPLKPETWQRAALNGDESAMREIEEHCVFDVDVLEEVCWAIRGYVKQIDRAGSYR